MILKARSILLCETH